MRQPALFPAPPRFPEHLVHFSGGITSYATARRVAETHGTDGLVLLFTDTLIEDPTTYSFLIEGARDVFDWPTCVTDLVERCHMLPADMDERLAALLPLAGDAMARVPGLVWVIDGRHPWQVFEDERFIGNSSKDPCSRHLKRVLLDRWRKRHGDPARTTVYVGLNWEEPERLERLRANEAKRVARLKTPTEPWRFEAPLMDPPWESKKMLLDAAQARGLRTPALYHESFSHNNCSGACVKGGHGHWAQVLARRPEVFADWERREMVLMEDLGSEWGMLRDRSGGTTTPLPLSELRERIEDGAEVEQTDLGFTCGCALW